jgi:hypothetical protein
MNNPQRFLHTEDITMFSKKAIDMNADEVEFLVIDEFAGFGGTSTGFDQSDAKAIVVAAITMKKQ